MFSSWFPYAAISTRGMSRISWSVLSLPMLRLRVRVTQSSDTCLSRIGGGGCTGWGKGAAATALAIDWRFEGRSYGLGDGGERVRFCLPERCVRNDGERMSTSIMVGQKTGAICSAMAGLLVVWVQVHMCGKQMDADL